MNILLWVLQVLLAVVFIAHGLLLLMPPPDIAAQMVMSLPRWFWVFLGVAERRRGDRSHAAWADTGDALARHVGGRRHHDRHDLSHDLSRDAQRDQLRRGHVCAPAHGDVRGVHAPSRDADRSAPIPRVMRFSRVAPGLSIQRDRHHHVSDLCISCVGWASLITTAASKCTIRFSKVILRD